MMRLTILTETFTVGKDGFFYEPLDFSSCGVPQDIWAVQWYGDHGHIEFVTDIPNQDITELPVWATACLRVWEAKDYQVKNPPPPTPEQLVQINREKARYELEESDWATLPDVNLANKEEWVAYRSALREIFLAPTTQPVWPTKPEAVWN